MPLLSSTIPERPHPLARAPIVDRINAALDNSWSRGWLSRPSLDPGELWRKGARGFDDIDELGGRSEADAADFRERLERLCASLIEEAELNPVGLTMAHGQLVRAVRQRLALGQLWRREPELLHTRLAPPILVVGQMRSGTTRLHRLLAADPAHCATRFCDSWHPVPARGAWQPDTRPLWSGVALFMARRLDPWIDSIHPFGTTRHDEELGWLASALDHSAYEAQWHIPSYVAHCEARDATPVWREFARILRTDAAHRGNAARPRVMKVPQFSEQAAALLRQFPDARVVLSSRCEDAVARSSTSLVANQMTIQSDGCDLDRIEAEWRRKIALRRSRTANAMAAFDGAVAEVDFDALGADWLATMRAVYLALGLPFGPDVREAMATVMARAANGEHLGHARQLDRFATAA